jgi:hypothetical protein
MRSNKKRVGKKKESQIGCFTFGQVRPVVSTVHILSYNFPN